MNKMKQNCMAKMIMNAYKPECPEELENNLNSDLYKISEYFNINRLSLNAHKCEFMLIGTYQSLAKMPEISIHINNDPLHKVTISKYLGMFIDSNLKWDDHNNNMIPKISAKIGIFRSLRNIVPTDTLIQIYNAIVQPHLDYGDAVYDSATQTSTNRLQKSSPNQSCEINYRFRPSYKQKPHVQ